MRICMSGSIAFKMLNIWVVIFLVMGVSRCFKFRQELFQHFRCFVHVFNALFFVVEFDFPRPTKTNIEKHNHARGSEENKPKIATSQKRVKGPCKGANAYARSESARKKGSFAANQDSIRNQEARDSPK
eukprot:UN19893